MAKQEVQLVSEIEQEYIQAGYTQEEVALLEEAAVYIQGLKQNAAQSIIEIGKKLLEVKDATQHGSWQFFLEYRCGISEDSSRRFMAAARVVTNYPQLEENIGNISQTALYVLGQNKRVSEAVVQEVIECSDEGEVNEAFVRDVINKHTPPEEPKASKLGFVPIDQVRASGAIEKLSHYAQQVYGSIALAGVDVSKIRKSKGFKEFCDKVKKNDDGEFSSALHGLMVASYVLNTSAEIEEFQEEE